VRHLRWIPLLASPILANCHSVRPVQPADLSARASLQRVWVTRSDRSTVVLDEPRLAGDTLTGLTNGEPQSIPLSDATVIRSRQPAPGRTVMLAILAGAATLGTLFYLEHRPDVGNAAFCGAAIGSRPNPFGNCCLLEDTTPC